MKDETDFDLNYAKFSQNQTLARKLVETRDALLLEATRDTHFGTRMTLSQVHTIDANAPGNNVQGKNLEEVRQKLTEENVLIAEEDNETQTEENSE